MSLALFRSELRTAVRAAQDDATPICAPTSAPALAPTRRPPTPQADVLRRVGCGELRVEAALAALGVAR